MKITNYSSKCDDFDYFYPLQLLCNLDYHIREKKVGICFVFSGEAEVKSREYSESPEGQTKIIILYQTVESACTAIESHNFRVV